MDGREAISPASTRQPPVLAGPVEQIDIEAFRRDRDQLWAEAAIREAKGQSTRLDPELWQAAAEEQAAREAPNPIKEQLASVLAGREGIIFADDAWTILNIPVQQQAAHYGKLGKAMQDLGWTRKKRRRRAGADQSWAYVRGEEKYRISAKRYRGDLIVSAIRLGADGFEDEDGIKIGKPVPDLDELPDDLME